MYVRVCTCICVHMCVRGGQYVCMCICAYVRVSTVHIYMCVRVYMCSGIGVRMTTLVPVCVYACGCVIVYECVNLYLYENEISCVHGVCA